MNPTFVMVGRPNVGKSSLFNALLGYRRSIVSEKAGTTLDRIRETVTWDGEVLSLSDTQGALKEEDASPLREVLSGAEAILFVVDAKVGVTPFDCWIGTILHQSKKPTLLIVNKNDGQDPSVEAEFAELGFFSVSASAAHKFNLAAVKTWCVDLLRRLKRRKTSAQEPLLTMALMGRPNTGKSTLMNRLCGETISRVSPLALTTRDPVSYALPTEGGPIRLLDTAGIRRPRSKKDEIEVFSIHAATRSLRASDVAVLLIASHEAITDQDMRLLNLLVRENKPALILLNFWDSLSSSQKKHFLEDSEFGAYLRQFAVLPISAKTGFNTEKIINQVLRLSKQSKKRIQTSKLNRMVERLIEKNPPPTTGKQNFNILYASQVGVEPPTFVFFMNRRGALPASYQKYLESQLRKSFKLKGQPIRLYFRGGEERAN